MLFMGKSTINWPFSSSQTVNVYRRVSQILRQTHHWGLTGSAAPATRFFLNEVRPPRLVMCVDLAIETRVRSDLTMVYGRYNSTIYNSTIVASPHKPNSSP